MYPDKVVAQGPTSAISFPVYSNPVMAGGGSIPWFYAPLTSDLTLTYGTGNLTPIRTTGQSGKTDTDLVYFEDSTPNLEKDGQLSTAQFSKDAWDTQIYGPVVIQAADGTFQLFYTAYSATTVYGPAYATSTDLVNWTKPVLGQISFGGNTNNNLMVVHDGHNLTDVIVAEGSYVMVLTNPQNSVTVYSSTTGVFVLADYVTKAIDINLLGYNLESKGIRWTGSEYWIFYTKDHETDRRSIGYYSCATLGGTWVDQGLFTEFTSAAATRQFYDILTWEYAGSLWANIPIYNEVTEVLGPCELWKSADSGATWTLQGDMLELGGSGEFDENLMSVGRPIMYNGQWRMMYAGSTLTHDNWFRPMEFGMTTGDVATYWGNQGVLLQKIHKNLLLHSNALDNAVWDVPPSDERATHAQDITGPDGTTSAWTINDPFAGEVGRLEDNPTIVNATTYTLSCFIKKTTASTVYPGLLARLGTTYYGICFDANNGTAVKVSFADAGTAWNIERFNDDYWWVSVTGLSNGTTSNIVFYPAYNGTGGDTSDVTTTGNNIIYNLQLETGAYATTPILTGAAAVQYDADVLELNQAPPTNDFYVELDWTPREDTAGVQYIWSSYLDDNNYLRLYYSGTNVIFDKTIGGVTYDANYTINVALGTTYTLKGVLDSTDGVQVYVDGVAGTPDTNTLLAVPGTTTQIGADGDDADQTAMAVKGLSMSLIAGGADMYAPLTISTALGLGTETPTFTRATIASIVDEDGVVIPLDSGEAGFYGAVRNAANDYTDNGFSKGVLIEKAATNLARYWNDITTDWVGVNDSSTANLLQADNVGSTGVVSVQESGISGTAPVLFSVYAKASTLDFIVLRTESMTNNGSTGFDLTDGTWIKFAGHDSAGTEYMGNGWYRCWIIFSGADVTGIVRIHLATAINPNIVFTNVPRNGTSAVEIKDISVQSSAYPTLPVPTPTASDSRNASVLSYNLTPATNDITFQCAWTPFEDTGEIHYIISSYSGANDYIRLMYDGTDIIMRKTIGGTHYDARRTTNIVSGNSYLLVGRISSTAGVDLWVDSVKGTNDSNTTNAVVGTTIEIGSDGNGGGQQAMAVKEVSYYE